MLKKTAGEPPDEDKVDLGEKAYRLLYSEIVRCCILPGQDITEAQMCERYGLSRSPVRRALALLAHDGLITPIPRFGFHVSDISLATIRQTFEMRASLEGLAASACIGRIDVEALRSLNADYVRAANAGAHDMLERHNRIHALIYAATNNPILEKFLTQLLHQSNRIAHFLPKVGGLGFMGDEVAADEHEALFAALTIGDGEAAAAIFQSHVKDSEQRVIDSLLGSPRFTDLPIRIGEGLPAGEA